MEWKPIIPSSEAEEMNKHYDSNAIGITYENKIILDLGAANGDSSEYFIHMGARFVIAVDGAKDRYENLVENSKLFNGKIIPILLFITKPEEIENLIIVHKPDIVKADIEGAEIYLCAIKDEIWNMVPEYIVETHEGYLHNSEDEKMREKCNRLNYRILKDKIITYSHIIYAIKS
jgi:hypothetical protein